MCVQVKEEKKELSRDDKKRLMKQRKDMIKNGTYIHTLYYTTTTNSPVLSVYVCM